jgi:spore maturation protein CgeB
MRGGIVSERFHANLRALEERSPEAAARVRRATPDPALRVVRAASGLPVLEAGGRALDSLREPDGTAARLAGRVEAGDRIVVAGLGTGYLAEALVRRGLTVVAVVEASPAVLAAAMDARDLQDLLRQVPVRCLDTLADPVELATLRASADVVVPHGPSVTRDADLAALVARWPSIRVARRLPRVLVVGPIYGGSLEVARSAAAAVEEAGARARLADMSVHAEAFHALGSLEAHAGARAALQERLAHLLGDAVVAVAAEWKPDLVLALAQAPLAEPALHRLRGLGIATAFWFVENFRVLPYWTQVARHYDWFYAIQPGEFLERLAGAGAPRPRYLPMAFDPGRHHPVPLTAEEAARFESEISFAGSPYLNRQRIFDTLRDLPLRLWGPGWAEAGLADLAAEGGRSFTLPEMVRIFAGSRINLNVHSAAHVDGLDPAADYVNPRTFELAGCEAFQLTDRRGPLPALFEPDEIATFASVRELRVLVDHFLARHDERRTMAVRARVRALAHHTYLHRVERILRDALAPELVAAARTRAKVEPLVTELARAERDHATLEADEALMRMLQEIGTAWGRR